MEVEEYVEKLIKTDGWRDPEFLFKRIKEKTGGSYAEAEDILKRIVKEDRSLRFINVVAEGRIGLILPEGKQPRKKVVAYYRSLNAEPTKRQPTKMGFYPKKL